MAPATPEDAPRYAQGWVEDAEQATGTRPDYSVASLEFVDAMADALKDEPVEEVFSLLFGAGMYVGEVFVRNAGGCWREATDADRHLTTGPVVLELPGPTTISPVDKVLKRHSNGPGDSVVYYYQVFNQQGR